MEENTPEPPPPPDHTTPLGPLESTALPRPWGFWATLGWSILIFAFYLAAQWVALWVGVTLGVFRFRSVEAILTSGWVLSVVNLSCAPVLVGLSFLFAGIRRGIRVRDYLGLSLPGKRTIVAWSVALTSLGIVYDAISILCGKSVMYETIAPMYQSAVYLPLFWSALLVGAPVGEEIFFRGFLLAGWQRSRLGSVGAVVLIAAIWAFIHHQYDLWEKCEVFIVGIGLGFVRIRTGSVLLCILAHSLMNLVGGIEIAFFLSGRR